MVPRDQRDLIGTWFDAQGRPLPDGTNASNGILVIQTGSGSTSCYDRQRHGVHGARLAGGSATDWTSRMDPVTPTDTSARRGVR